MMLVNAEEKRCIQTLAKWFEQGETRVHGADALDRMGLTWERFNPLMRKMGHLGAVEIVLGMEEDPVDCFVILPGAVELARELDEGARKAAIAPDFVEQIQTRFRRHRVAGWVIVIIVVATVLMALLASTLSVLESLGLLP